jgi:hypothetical protein
LAEIIARLVFDGISYFLPVRLSVMVSVSAMSLDIFVVNGSGGPGMR